MPSDRLIVLLLAAAFLAAFLGIPLALWWERRRPSSFTQSPEYLKGAGEPSLEVWRGLSTDQQAAYDNAVLDANEAAEDAVRRAVDARLEADIAQAVKRNALFRP